MPMEPAFEVAGETPHETSSTLVIGLSQFGMAGITAVDYIVKQLPSEEIGHILPEDLPAITPFQDGSPRHHTRIYNLLNEDITVMVGELFIPMWASNALATSLISWIESTDIDEILVLHGIPYPHGPEDHRVFYVATNTFEELRLNDSPITPLAGGFLDGTVGELTTRSLDQVAPPTGVLITPTHPPGPDIDASLQFLDALKLVYDVDIDETELRQASDELKKYYQELDERLQSLSQSDQSLTSRDFHEDRMYM